MKNWVAHIKIEWKQYGIEAKNKKEAIKLIKELFKEQYGLELENTEFLSVVEDKGE